MDYLFGLVNSNPNSIKSSRPLKAHVTSEFDDDYKTNRMQDVEEFINYIVSGCSILKSLTNFSVDITYQCSDCGNSSTIIDNMNIRYENLYANSILRLLQLKSLIFLQL